MADQYRGWTPDQIVAWTRWQAHCARAGLKIGSDREWTAWIAEHLPDPERDKRLRTLSIDRSTSRPPTAAELANAREAQKWANHIQARENREYFQRARTTDAIRFELDEIPVWSDETAARLRYIARTGKFPGPSFDWTKEP